MKEYSVEPLDLMQRINKRFHEPFIHEVIEFDGEIDIERLNESADKLLEKCPLLKCRYDEKRNKYIEIEGFSHDDVVFIEEGGDIEKLIVESLADSFIKIYVANKTTLVFTVSHMVCDGNGLR